MEWWTGFSKLSHQPMSEDHEYPPGLSHQPMSEDHEYPPARKLRSMLVLSSQALNNHDRSIGSRYNFSDPATQNTITPGMAARDPLPAADHQSASRFRSTRKFNSPIIITPTDIVAPSNSSSGLRGIWFGMILGTLAACSGFMLISRYSTSVAPSQLLWNVNKE